ncbi:hypothetical protein M408DRAFT_27711 [Serendipita vermifera MAFF 305830]|uniref:BTB domain-containing protein n=1 Tax=Serendipita vermifera MAFF 305830 TaxID=933852 RepID=A0A0C2WYK9_SERVB|nr:hypothetical protein M408DRAFT_28721 [Serendipita vermifera MAFF 305830]KIM23617.1 hypothetical protein M408DRAFT_27711 [Serendipita vermifera MAFF 305830]
MVDNRYTITVGTEQFRFTRDQLESDPGNYFATYFFGEFTEASQGARELVIEKDIQLFRLIQAHLRGYDIFPLPDAAVPPYMTKEVAIKNLRHDAQFYCLGKLEGTIKDLEQTSVKKEVKNGGKSPLARRYKAGECVISSYLQTWTFQEINNDGYQLMLDKLKNIDIAIPSRRPQVPGFSVTFCWVKENYYYALLVSDD